MRTLVTLACTECKRRNYTTKKNKQNNPDRIGSGVDITHFIRKLAKIGQEIRQ